MVDISIIKGPKNSILVQIGHPYPIVILVYFKGLLIQVENVDKPDFGDDVYIENHRVESKIPTEREGASNTYTLASTSTCDSIESSIVFSYTTTIGIIGTLLVFLQHLVEWKE